MRCPRLLKYSARACLIYIGESRQLWVRQLEFDSLERCLHAHDDLPYKHLSVLVSDYKNKSLK